MNGYLTISVLIIVALVSVSGCIDLGNDQNNTTTTDNTSSNGNDNSSGSDDSGPKLIDTGTANVGEGITYTWKTYENNPNDIVTYATYKTENKTVKQTITIVDDPDQAGLVNIYIVPKASGQSSWFHVTSKQGYSTVVEYYWNVFRGGSLEGGPSH
jgi:hypothetical protein